MIIRCGHCDNTFYISPDKKGQTVSCIRCNHPVEATLQSEASSDSKTAPVCKPIIGNNLSSIVFDEPTNLSEGFRRLTLVISCLFGPVVYVVLKAKDLYTLNARFNEPLDKSLQFLILWATCFTCVWMAYAISVLIAKSFNLGGNRRNPKSVKKPLAILCLLSLLPLVPAVIDTVKYISDKPLWYFADIKTFFLPWPLAGFLFTWGIFCLTWYITVGFRKTFLDQRLEHIRRMEEFKTAPAMRQSGNTWRNT